MDILNIIFSIITIIAFIYTGILITFYEKFERDKFLVYFYRVKILLYILTIYWMTRFVLALK